MKNLETLIRLRKQDVDDRRVFLTSIEARRASILSAIEELKIQRACEQEVAAGKAIFQSVYADYAARSNLERQRLESERSTAEIELGVAREELAAAFLNLKKYEIALEARRREQHRQLTLHESKILDEIGTQNRSRR